MSGDAKTRPPIAWTGQMAGNKLAWIPILYPKAHSTVVAFSLTDQVEGVLQHYDEERGRPCTGDRDTCHWCRTTPYRPRWYGYLAGWNAHSGRYCLLQITKHAALKCPELRHPKSQLRGKRITLKRLGLERTGHVLATVEDVAFKGDLPPAFDVRSALEVVWFGDLVLMEDGKDGVQ